MTAKIYFHGIPGSAAELTIMGADGTAEIWAPNRLQDAPHLQFTDYLDHLAGEIERRYPDGPLHLIGFSLGARVALEIAVRYRDRVEKVDLISPAAPLESGIDLNSMAGGAVFRIARDSPRQFAWITAMQSMVTSISAALMFNLLFRSAKGADQALAKDPAFKRILKGILQNSFSGSCNGYRREIEAYVAPWIALLDHVRAPVTLWHGSADNWSPPEMSDWLAKTLPNVIAHHILDGQSHYSTLKQAVV